MKFRTILSLPTLTAVFLLPAAILAQTSIFTNFGPAPGYSTTTAVTVTKQNPIAVAFTIAQQVHINTIELPLGFASGTTPVSFTLDLFTNSGAVPSNTSIFSTTGSVTTGSAVLYPLSATSSINLNPGTYWIALSQSSNTDINWYINDSGASGYALKTGSNWSTQSGSSPAFRVTASAVPEFGSVWSLGALLLAGGAGLWWRKRRQREAA